MLFLTSQEKRERVVSEAVIEEAKGNKYWFMPIKDRIDKAILDNPGKMYSVVLKWVKTAEAAHATVIKEQILKLYDHERKSPEGNQG